MGRDGGCFDGLPALPTERAADHAVDIAEQASFLMTGELRELDRRRSADVVTFDPSGVAPASG